MEIAILHDIEDENLSIRVRYIAICQKADISPFSIFFINRYSKISITAASDSVYSLLSELRRL